MYGRGIVEIFAYVVRAKANRGVSRFLRINDLIGAATSGRRPKDSAESIRRLTKVADPDESLEILVSWKIEAIARE